LVKNKKVWYAGTVDEPNLEDGTKISLVWHSTGEKEVIALSEFEDDGDILQESDETYSTCNCPDDDDDDDDDEDEEEGDGMDKDEAQLEYSDPGSDSDDDDDDDDALLAEDENKGGKKRIRGDEGGSGPGGRIKQPKEAPVAAVVGGMGEAMGAVVDDGVGSEQKQIAGPIVSTMSKSVALMKEAGEQPQTGEKDEESNAEYSKEKADEAGSDSDDEEKAGEAGSDSDETHSQPALCLEEDCADECPHCKMPEKDSCKTTPCAHCAKFHCNIHDKQCEVAARLLATIRKELKDNTFSDFDVCVLVPDLNSLEGQTLDRLSKFIRQRMQTESSFLGGRLEGGRVFKAMFANKSLKILPQEMEEFLQKIQTNTRVLYLLVHDEAHYHATPKGAVDAFLNDRRVLSAPNVVTLLVSATPYNLVTKDSRIPEQNVVNWMRDPNEAEFGAYYGLIRYAKCTREKMKKKKTSGGGYITSDDDFERKLDESIRANARSISKAKEPTAAVMDSLRCDQLAEEYTEAMQSWAHSSKKMGSSGGAGRPSTNNETQHIVDNLLSQFYEGNNVLARSKRHPTYYPGKITRAHSGGTYDILYDDKHAVSDITPDDIRLHDGIDSGCMVLIRVAKSKNGKLGVRFASRIKEGRKKAGLEGKFAVLLDLSQRKAPLSQSLQKDSPALYDRLVSRKQRKYRELVSWCMVYEYGVWCMLHGVWCMMYGVWCMMYGV
jgi:hypothetical protein